jgi:two-component system, chemotaxis family, chemotaxis protein CheY
MMRALIIDDSLSMRMYIASMIEDQGFETEMACDGQDALRKLKATDSKGGFDVATVDWDMPVMDGPSFVAAVRADAKYRDMKLLMLTARQHMDEVVKALAIGADDYLMKPVTPEMLEEKIRLVGLGR